MLLNKKTVKMSGADPAFSQSSALYQALSFSSYGLSYSQVWIGKRRPWKRVHFIKKPLGEWNPSAKRFQVSYLNLSMILSSQELFPLYCAQSSPMRWA